MFNRKTRFLSFLVLSFLYDACFIFCQDCSMHETVQQECITLTLEGALTRALNYNRQLMNNADNTVKAQYGVTLAQSEFDIQITPNGRAGYIGGGKEGDGASAGGGVEFSKKFTTGTTVSVEPSILKTPDRFHADLRTTITQPLLRGFGREYQLSNLKGAEFTLRTACRNLFISQLQLAVRTINALYEVVKARKAVELNHASHERVKKFYEAAKLKEKIGLSDSLDVYRAEIELQQAEDQFTSSQERLQESEDTLKDLLALPINMCISIDVPLVYTPSDTEMDEALQLAFQHRIEIDQAEDQWRENYRLTQIAKKNLYPELNLVLNYSNCGHDPYFSRACTCHRENMWGIGFTTSSNFNPLGEQIAYEQSLMAVQSAERGIEQTKANITLDVKKALRQLQRAYKRIDLQQQQIKSAEGQLHLAKLKFDRGLANNFDIIQAEKTLRSAQNGYWSALIDHIVGEYQLLLAVGMLTDKPCIQ